MRKILYTSIILSFSIIIQAQNKSVKQYLNELDTLNMKATLSKLASDEFMGRDAQDGGLKLSSEYLSKYLHTYKLKSPNKNSSYQQDICAFNQTKASKFFKLSSFNYAKLYSYKNETYQDSIIEGNQIVFAGYGVYHPTFNDFKNVNVKDKIVILLKGEGPINCFGVKKHSASDYTSQEYFKKQQPKAVLSIQNGFRDYYSYSSSQIKYTRNSDKKQYAEVEINELLANKLLEPTGKTVKQLLYESEKSDSSLSFEFSNSVSFKGDYSYKNANLHNLIAMVEGSDLKNEYIIVSAHYDHIGLNYRGEVYNGADDNASGVSALLEIARVLNQMKKKGKGPRRTVVFILFTSEEQGLKGSEYYTENPIFPLEKTKACLNMDMLGRVSSSISENDQKQEYVHAITGYYSANALSPLIDSINKVNTKLAIPKTHGSFFSRSDHYVFHKKGIPSVMFTNDEHEDLHEITDDFEKINFKVLLKRTKLVFLTLWELANTPESFQKD